jgi:hypothetical protein
VNIPDHFAIYVPKYAWPVPKSAANTNMNIAGSVQPFVRNAQTNAIRCKTSMVIKTAEHHNDDQQVPDISMVIRTAEHYSHYNDDRHLPDIQW